MHYELEHIAVENDRRANPKSDIFWKYWLSHNEKAIWNKKKERKNKRKKAGKNGREALEGVEFKDELNRKKRREKNCSYKQ